MFVSGLLKGSPDSSGLFADSLMRDQFPGQRGQDVVVFVYRLESATIELTFHGQRDEQLLTHQSQTGHLCRPGIDQKPDPNRVLLADAPTPSAGLAQDVYRKSVV